MIGQYLPNNNENATIPILPKILHLNRASRACSAGHISAGFNWFRLVSLSHNNVQSAEIS
jgi:hypothetical protein